MGISNIKKFLVAVAGVFAVLGTVLADGAVSGTEGTTLFAAVLTAVGVYFAKNTPKV